MGTEGTGGAIEVGANLSLVVLGCDGSYAGPGGACSGYLVTSPEASVWLDAGTGTLGRVQQHVRLPHLTATVITHEHPDHCGELPVLHNALKYLLDVRDHPVVTTAGTQALVEHVSGGASPTFAWDVVRDGDERTIGDLRFLFARTDHPVETLAVRVDHPSGCLAYSSDTGASFDGRALDPDGTGVDVLVVEASMPPQLEDRAAHLSGAQAARVALECGARRVVVTHVSPGDDAHRRGGEVEAALRSHGSDAAVVVAADHQTRWTDRALNPAVRSPGRDGAPSRAPTGGGSTWRTR